MHDAFGPEEWLAAHGDHLFRYAMQRVRDRELALDLVQETLLAAWRGRKGFQGNAALRTWLIGILKHKITDHIRREIRQRELARNLESDPTSRYFDEKGHWQDGPQQWRHNPESQALGDEFRRILEHCLARLPIKQRRAFELREIVGESADEICKALEITTTNFHVLLHRARLALRHCLEHHGLGRKP